MDVELQVIVFGEFWLDEVLEDGVFRLGVDVIVVDMVQVVMDLIEEEVLLVLLVVFKYEEGCMLLVCSDDKCVVLFFVVLVMLKKY